MANMKFSDILSITDPECISAYEEIGRTDAFVVRRFQDLLTEGLEVKVDGRVADGLNQYSRSLLRKESPFVVMVERYMMAQAVGKGPKVFRPTDVQALMSMEMKLNIEFGGYNQPFPTTIIELPEFFKEGRKLSDGCRPEIVILHHLVDQRSIFCSVICQKHVSHKVWWVPEDDSELLETFLEADEHEPKDYYDCIRAAMSYCLLLDEYGVKRIGPDNKDYYERLKKKKKKPTARHKENARLRLATLPIVYEIDQTPVLYRRELIAREPGDPTGRLMPPHVRRGHYRMQAHGVGNSLRKRIRIPATFVNDHLFVGSMKDLRATYSHEKESKVPR